jgi:hypothetical protein
MGSGSAGGGNYLETPEETQQKALQNQLLQTQVDDAMRQRKEDEYKHSPDYLNQQAAQASSAARAKYASGKTDALTAGQNNIRNAFKDLGEPGGAAPYLAALQADADKMDYHQGGAAAYADTPYDASNWNEQAYLDANPDVAAAVQANKASGGRAGVGFTSGLDHYQKLGQSEGRPTVVRNVNPAGTDTWDDPSSLATKDYIGSAIDNIRLGRKNSARDTAETTGTQRLADMGLDADTTTKLQGLFDSKLGTTYTNAGTSANDYTGVFDPDAILNSVVDTERSSKRGGYTTATRAAFGGVDPEKDFADTADDSYINDIVGRSFTDAHSALDRAKARGSLTDTGYNAGLSYLGDQNTAALTNAQALGGAVLTRDRGTLSGIKNDALTTAGGWDFGQKFDPNSYLDQYNTKKGSLTEGLGGEISNALAGQKFFDVGDVLTKAGYAQGAQNVNPLQSGFQTPALSALQGERDKNRGSPRGLGGTGVF